MSTDAVAFPPPPPLSRHPVDVGNRTEAAIARELLRRGYLVLQPLGVNQRYDLVVDFGDRFARIQCKTGRFIEGAIKFSAHSVRSTRRGVFRRGYAGEIDYFAVWCPDTEGVYVVPIEECPSVGGSLRVTPTRNGQVRGVRWARDYELPSIHP